MLPKITLFVIGQQKIEQDYDNLQIERLNETGVFAQTFNLQQKKFPKDGLYGYLLPYHNFNGPTVLTHIVSTLSINTSVFGMYTDCIDSNNICQHYPAYNPDIFNKKQIIVNTPIFTKQLVTFDERIENLLFYDILKNCSNQIVWFHDPNPLINLSPYVINPVNDLKIITEKRK
jgi:hypothetical protein